MVEGSTGWDWGFLAWCLRQPALPHHKLATLCPDFLIIAPPKTGSTWLAANLRCHSALFVPEIKEIKYFSSYYKWLGLDWYLDHFTEGAGRRKGEASPTYASLPVERIRMIRRLMPDVKLIFLMRDPIARAWSHAKHNFRFREANFADFQGDFEQVTDCQWRENFHHDWPLVSGDYLGQLRRWLSVFPREQFYIGFYESIASAPDVLLREVFQFLEVAPDVDLTHFPALERVFPGLTKDLPAALRPELEDLLAARTRELASFLREQFGLRLPSEWPSHGDAAIEAPAAAAFQREFDDRYLSRVVALEESFPSAPRLVRDNYRDYHLVFYRGRFYALARGFPGRVDEIEESQLSVHRDCGACFIAESLAEVKEAVDQYLFERSNVERGVVESLQSDLDAARRHIARLEEALHQAARGVECLQADLRRIETDLANNRPLHTVVAQYIRKAWRRLRRKADAS